MIRAARLALPVLLLLLAAACATKHPALPPDTPPDLSAALSEVLRTAGDNRREIETFLARYPQDPEMREAAFFLAANLPAADRPRLSTRDLSENLEYAFLARRTLPWGQDVPWGLFLNYVLPHRVTQEPFEPWRQRFFEELAPGQANATMLSAARALNQWAFAQAGFDTTARWDQNPAMTLRRGFGRCEEQVILLASALRAIGIPAREAGVSSWQHVNDNHVWVEAWLDGTWRVFEAGSPGRALTANALKSPLVYAPAYGPVVGQTANPEDPVLRQGPGFTLVNVSRRYVPTGEIAVRVRDEAGQPLAGATVFVSSFNYGSFRPGLRLTCDQEGRASFVTGPATYLLSTARNGRTDTAFASWNPDGADFPASVELNLDRERLPEGTVRMRFAHGRPNPNLANASAPVLASEGETPDPAVLARREEWERDRLARFAEFRTLGSRAASWALVHPQGTAGAAGVFDGGATADAGDSAAARAADDATGNTAGNRTASATGNATGKAPGQAMARQLAQARGNAPEVARALRAAAARSPELAALVEGVLNATDPKDLLSLTAPELLEDARLALDARTQARALGLEYDRDVFVKEVAASRIEFESFAFWRAELAPVARKMFGQGFEAGVRRVNEQAHALGLTPPSFLGPRPGPADMVRTGFAVAPVDKAVLACALLRAAGVPARVLEEWGWVEYFDGREYRPLYPDRPEALGDPGATRESAAWYGEPVEVRLRFTREGQTLSEKEAPYFRTFTISRLTPAGTFDSLEDSLKGEFLAENKEYVLQLPEGRFWLFAASRNAAQEPKVRMIRLDVSREKGPLSLEVDLTD
jgi:transglutaminase-like putative cysteine protease